MYDLRCPECGVAKRNTRLAATIHSLRHTFGWLIETRDKPGMLAEYRLQSRAQYPRIIGEEALVSPIRLYPTVEDVPKADAWTCAVPVKNTDGTRECGSRNINPIGRLLGGWVTAQCMVHGVQPHRPEGTK